MKKLLVYATKGGDTKIVSEYIASKLGFEIKEAKELNAEDLAGACLFLCSSKASWVTGHTFIVDGGTTFK